MRKNKKIAIALSGGVDSSVAALLLKNAGYDVFGVYFKTYKPFGDKTHCKEAGESAKRVADTLSIPFFAIDLEQEYKKRVFDYLIDSYSKGLTPNPDIICNREIKFGIFLDKARELGAEMLATGHYANVYHKNNLFNTKKYILLKMAKDKNKDQTYFLSQVKKDALSKTIFPLAKLTKPQVRKIAKKYGLHTADKKDSQGICFIGHELDVKKFLKHFVPHNSGKILSLNGDIIGEHQGSVLYTIGERRGFHIFPKFQSPNQNPLYIIDKNTKENTIIVGSKKEFDAHQKNIKFIKINNLNWISKIPKINKNYTCRIRHRGELQKCKITQIDHKTAIIKFKEPPFAPAQGQFIAIYKNNTCLGGGEIQKVIHNQN